MKEIGYLWERSFLPKSNYVSRFLSKHWYYQARRKYIITSLQSHLQSAMNLKVNRKKLAWDLHYFLLPHTDSWYERLFENDSVTGDITPKYCELNEVDIFRIKRRYGDIKIIITVRDPVEREWSRAKMNLCRKQNRHPSEISEHEWIQHFDNLRQSESNDYLALYNRWAGVFGEEKIHLVFYDEICLDGWLAFYELCQFLEISQPPDGLKRHVLKPTNVGIKGEIPMFFEEYLLSKHEEKIIQLAESFPNYRYPSQWLEKHRRSSGFR